VLTDISQIVKNTAVVFSVLQFCGFWLSFRYFQTFLKVHQNIASRNFEIKK